MAEKMLVSASMGVIGPLLGKLAALMGEEYSKLKGVRKQAAFLHEELSSMGALLEDLADMEGLDNQTKQWRNKVREMSYDIEDCLDDFQRRVGCANDGKGLLRRLKALRARHQLANQIQELKAHVREASERRMRYKLDDLMSRSASVVVDPRMTALYEETSRLVGIDGPKEEVINLLTKQVGTASVQDLRVVSIVGFGGLGKTTLANEVYSTIGKHFSCKAFVSVSQRPDMMMLLKSLVTRILGPGGVDTYELHGLIDNLRKYLHDKRYLVVVDDLWDASAWEFIKCAFPEGHNGSRVLTTTRIERVAVTCCNYQWEFVYRMKPLDDHNSRQLFYCRVFGVGNTCPQPFEEPSDKILQKCGGLPLAIISIASLLASQSNRSVREWNYVLNSLRSDLRSNPTLEGMRQILNLSYTHLPHHLKTCLLYIGMYPEDHEIGKDHLVMQWIAERFVSGLDGRDALEIAGSYFNELVNRSMINQFVEHCFWRPEHIYYKVHDMVLDLIVSKSAEENFLGVFENLQTITTRQCVRRLSLQSDESGLDKSEPHTSLTHVRSLFIFGLPLRSLEMLELKFVRVLFICKDCDLDATPIAKLYQLRYLYIKSLYIRHHHYPDIRLPKQICGLQHLETLMIEGQLSALPHDIVHLPALSYLKVEGAAYPDGIINMKSLRILASFDPSKQSVDNLRALGELLNLRELDVHISDPYFHTKETHKGALFSSIEKLLVNGNLRCLSVFDFNTDEPGYNGCYYSDEWNSLCLSSSHLEQLHLTSQLLRLPVWIGQLGALNSLEIQVVELCKDDVALLAGLPALARLVLLALSVPEEGIVFGSGTMFSALGYLESLPVGVALQFQAGAMPKLETLRLQMGVHQVKTRGVELAGLEHLPNLKKVAIGLAYSRFGDEKSEVPMVEAAIRSFFDQYEGRPTIHITSYIYAYED